ncbi:MAG: putative Ig domain-containing protein [Actinobacteria bacterium]|nr:putative Ig domain-containing protein [Actinomycetota bacterium]
MLEMIVAILIIGIVMGSLTMFFVSNVSATSRQGTFQTGAQLADDAIERARGVKGSAVLSNRDKSSSDTQWAAVTSTSPVYPYLQDMTEAYDGTAATGSGATATLPTSPVSVVINNLSYLQNWYIGTCWQPAAGGTCGSTQVTGYVSLYRVVVAVLWRDKACANSQCSFLSSTLISGVTSEPIFNSNAVAQPPTVTNPGAQSSEANIADTLTMQASGGAPPLVWSATGLPHNMSINPATGIISGTPDTANTYSVVVSATDAFNLVGSVAFSWTVSPALVLTPLGNQVSEVGSSVAVVQTVTGGITPYTWTTTPLPAGLSFNTSSGQITGAATAVTAVPVAVTITVTDGAGVAKTESFTWTVASALALTAITSRTDAAGTSPTVSATASGGVGPYTFSATGLPTGITLSSTATVATLSGKLTNGGTFSTVVTVTDAIGAVKATSFTWTVKGPTMTNPGNQSTRHGTTLSPSLTISASDGGKTITYSATGLPTGLSISSSTGKISGTVGSANSYTVTVTATDSNGSSSVTFTWTIT